ISPSGRFRSWISSIGNHEQCRLLSSCRSGGARGDRDNATMRRWFLGPLEKYGADLVLSGHDHSYARARKGGVTYLTSVSGPKYYDTSARDFSQNGATRVRWAERTSTYQAVTVSPTTLRVR